ncbi:MAG TPA: hypothetical protein DD727_01165 [Clostridiales bacterium]|nr:hypothetical protein [Clostridiales bacterium]
MEKIGRNIAEHLCNYIGETVTIYCTCGGESGSGFTGVVLSVNDCFVRLITCIGPAPGCALGSACNRGLFSLWNRRCCSGDIRSVGSVTDIPIDRIASFVHNAV